MKRILFITLITLSALSFSFSAFAASPQGSIKKTRPKYSMLQLTNSEMYRYGREMYLAGNDTEAARVFLNMLRLDCGNTSAQYHLRKIADRTPALAFLNKKLDEMPCKPHDFVNDALPPAFLYYEKDPAILLEELISDRQRRHLSEEELTAKIDRYAAMIKELEGTVSMLKRTAEKEPAAVTDAQVDPDTIARLEEGRSTAGRIAKEIALLKNQMASQRIASQKELQDMRTNLAEAEVRLDNENPIPLPPPAPSPAPAPKPALEYSENAKALLGAMAEAKAQLENKERALLEKDKTLIPLQARFSDIESRLQTIQTNLQNIQKP